MTAIVALGVASFTVSPGPLLVGAIAVWILAAGGFLVLNRGL